MPRPKLSPTERQRRMNERLAQWRARIPSATVASSLTSHPFRYIQPEPVSRLERVQSPIIQTPDSPETERNGLLLDDNYLADYEEHRPSSIPFRSLTLSEADNEPVLNPVLESIEQHDTAELRDLESPMDLDLTDIESQASHNLSDFDIAATPLPNNHSIPEIHNMDDTDSEYLSDSSSVILKNQLENTSNVDDDTLLDAQLRQESSSNDNIDLAAELAQHLIQFQSCSTAIHQIADRQHTNSDLEANQHEHVSLTQYNQKLISANIPKVISRPEFFTPASRQAHIPLPNWQYVFEGQGEDADLQANQDLNDIAEMANLQQDSDHLCLTCSEVEPVPLAVSFDIDSFLGFAQSLAFARQGVDFNLFPRFHTNIQNDLHLYMTVYHDYGRGERPVHVKLKKVPHYYAGRVLGHEDITFYIFFPRMYDPDKPTNFPGKSNGETHNLLRTWTDSILLPAIFRHIPATSRQHFPHSWEHARQKAVAHYKEHSTRIVDEKLLNQALLLHYSLHPQSLAAIWQDVQQQLTEPQNSLYHGAKLFFSSKNTKLRFSYSTLSAMWELFERPLTAALNLDYINQDEVWLDLGKEVAAQEYTLASEQLDADSQSVTGLLKTCCLENFARWAVFDEPNRSVTATLYPSAMLRDASNITLEMSRLSRQRREGWVFSQAYNSYKELFDAAKTKPFSNPYLQQLTWDSQITKMLQQQGRAHLTPNSKLQSSYNASKQRLWRSIKEGINLSYGVREEHRISLNFFNRVRTSLQSTGNWEASLGVIPSNSTHIRLLSTDDYLGYLASNANKYMAAFEWISTLTQGQRTSYEHCKLMTMLLQALPYTFDSGPISRQNELWKSQFQRRKGGVQVLGMGFKNTLATFGYMWHLPRIDWESMSFQAQITDQIAFTSSMLRDNYRRNALQVKNAKHDYARLEAAGQWLATYRDSENCLFMIFQFMIWLIIRAFRKEVWSHFKPQIYEYMYQEAEKGQLPLCEKSIQLLFTDEARAKMKVVTSARIKTKSIKLLVSRLWGIRDQNQNQRGPWENIPFRVLCLRAVELVEEHCSLQLGKAFHNTLQRYFIATNWLMPHPRDSQFFQKNQQKETMWIAVYHRRMIHSAVKWDANISLDLLLSTTLKEPTRYRYKGRPIGSIERMSDEKRQECKQLEYEYMPDWHIAYGDNGFIMRGSPDEQLADYLLPDATLSMVGEALERVWQQEYDGLPD